MISFSTAIIWPSEKQLFLNSHLFLCNLVLNCPKIPQNRPKINVFCLFCNTFTYISWGTKRFELRTRFNSGKTCKLATSHGLNLYVSRSASDGLLRLQRASFLMIYFGLGQISYCSYAARALFFEGLHIIIVVPPVTHVNLFILTDYRAASYYFLID